MTEVEFQVIHFSHKIPWVFCTFTIAFKYFHRWWEKSWHLICSLILPCHLLIQSSEKMQNFAVYCKLAFVSCSANPLKPILAPVCAALTSWMLQFFAIVWSDLCKLAHTAWLLKIRLQCTIQDSFSVNIHKDLLLRVLFPVKLHHLNICRKLT